MKAVFSAVLAVMGALALPGVSGAAAAEKAPPKTDAPATTGKPAGAPGPGKALVPRVHAEAPALPAPTHSTEKALGETLHAGRYAFCHDAKYPLTDDEVEWCVLLPPPTDARSARCDAFARACQAGATAKRVPPSKPIALKLPSFGGLGRLVFYALIAGTIGALLYLLARGLVGRRAPATPAGEQEMPRHEGLAAQAAQAAAIERDVNRLLARARAAAAAGDYLAAVSDLHAALLRRLEGDGHIRIHRSATNGDYVRELRARAPALAAPVGEFTGAVESVQFGVTPPANLYQALLERLTSLLAASARGVAAAVLLALALAGTSCDSTRSDWRDSPSGSAAVSAFLTAAGIESHERLRPLAELDGAKDSTHTSSPPGADAGDEHGAKEAKEDDKSGDDKSAEVNESTEGSRASLLPRPPRQLVILPDAIVSDADWAAVKAAAQKRELTIVVAGPRALPAWIPAELVGSGASGPIHVTPQLEHWRHPKLKTEGAGSDARAAERADLRLTAALPPGGWVNIGQPTPHRVLLRRGGKPYVVMVDLGFAHAILFGDGSLFTNASLAVADNGAIVHIVMSAAGGPVQIVTQETGLVATTPLDSVSRGRLAPFMAQLCAFLILLFVLRGAAFGKLMDRHVVRRRRFSEHIQALGLQYARARAGRHAATAYATWTVERLRERLPADRGLGELAAAIAARTGQPLGEVARLLFQSHQDEHADAEPRTRAAAEESLQTIRALGTLLASATGGRTTTTHLRQRETKS